MTTRKNSKLDVHSCASFLDIDAASDEAMLVISNVPKDVIVFPATVHQNHDSYGHDTHPDRDAPNVPSFWHIGPSYAWHIFCASILCARDLSCIALSRGVLGLISPSKLPNTDQAGVENKRN